MLPIRICYFRFISLCFIASINDCPFDSELKAMLLEFPLLSTFELSGTFCLGWKVQFERNSSTWHRSEVISTGVTWEGTQGGACLIPCPGDQRHLRTPSLHDHIWKCLSYLFLALLPSLPRQRVTQKHMSDSAPLVAGGSGPWVRPGSSGEELSIQ